MRFRIKKSKNKVPQIKQEINDFSWYTCKNCGYSFEGKFCASCGQSVKEVQQPIFHFLGDMFGALFALDMRAVRSVPMLLMKPGKLSSEYVDGKRAKHVAPFRFYLFVSIIFFFLIGMQTKNLVNENIELSPDEITAVDSIANNASKANLTINGEDNNYPITSFAEGVSLASGFEEILEAKLADSTISEAERAETTKYLNALDDPNYLISKVYQYVSWSFFILMPWFALILFLFSWKKRKYYVEHLVFSVNLHTFFFLVLILVFLISMALPNSLDKMGVPIFLFMAVYTIVGIRNFYKKKWWKAVFQTLLMFLLYIMSSLALIVIVILIIIRLQ